jgi:hypothetical protein
MLNRLLFAAIFPLKYGPMSDDLQSLINGDAPMPLYARRKWSAPRIPIFQLSDTARVLVAGQAPGNLADTTGTPFNDPSGDRLRDWMGVSREEFYDASRIAILPMGFCFPGYDAKGGDLPPMKRCAEVWRQRVLEQLSSDRRDPAGRWICPALASWAPGRKDTDRDCRELEMYADVTACSPCRTQAGGIPHG